jgi:hypothetical protein
MDPSEWNPFHQKTPEEILKLLDNAILVLEDRHNDRELEIRQADLAIARFIEIIKKKEEEETANSQQPSMGKFLFHFQNDC